MTHLCSSVKKMEKNLANSIQYLRTYWTDIYQNFIVGRQVGVDDKSYIRFAVALGMLLWFSINFRGKN